MIASHAFKLRSHKEFVDFLQSLVGCTRLLTVRSFHGARSRFRRFRVWQAYIARPKNRDETAGAAATQE